MENIAFVASLSSYIPRLFEAMQERSNLTDYLGVHYLYIASKLKITLPSHTAIIYKICYLP